MMSDLKPEWKVFARELVIDWNQTRAYMVAYPDSTYQAAKSSSSTLLTNPNLNSYIEEIQKDLSKLSGVTALRNILELKKIAYTNITDLKNGWLTEKEFEELSEEAKASLSEIQYTTRQLGENGELVEKIVKFKMHDKQKAIENLNKMLGFNAPEKIESNNTNNSDQPTVIQFVKKT